MARKRGKMSAMAQNIIKKRKKKRDVPILDSGSAECRLDGKLVREEEEERKKVIKTENNGNVHVSQNWKQDERTTEHYASFKTNPQPPLQYHHYPTL